MASQEHPNAGIDLDGQIRYDKHGRRLSEADANAAAAAIEHGEVEIDDSRVVYPRRTRGRPSLSESPAPGETSPKIEARVPATLKNQLTRHAQKQHRPTAEVVREALEEYLAHH